MSIEESKIREILVADSLSGGEKVGKTVKMTVATGNELTAAGKQTVFSQEAIVKIGIYYARVMDGKIKKKMLAAGKKKFKKNVEL